MSHQHEKLNYIEYPAKDLKATQAFFEQTFGWQFTYFGEDYMAFDNQGLEGGFYRAALSSSPEKGAGLLVFYSEDLEATQSKIEANQGIISHPIFSFPGGRRFHFIEPSGNEFAVWSE